MKKSVWIILPILALAGCSEATLGYGKGLSDIIDANLEESKVSYNKPTLKTIAPFSDTSEYMLVDSSSGLEGSSAAPVLSSGNSGFSGSVGSVASLSVAASLFSAA